MKFKYETKEDDRECVAFICENGNLAIKTRQGGCFMVSSEGESHMGAVDFKDWLEMSVPAHRFYPGDELTITF